MSLTIDTDTLHRWALDNGYVRLADITEFVRHQSEPDPQQVVELMTPFDTMMAAEERKAIEIAHAAVFKANVAQRWTSPRVIEIAHAAIDTANAVLDDKADDLFPVPSSADTLAALRKVFTLKGEQASRDLLAKYGAKNAGTVPDDKRREFIAEAEELSP